MSAMVATPCTAFDPSWYPDSGAIITSHLMQTILSTNYLHKACLCIGDGTGQIIDHVGPSSFHSQLNS